MVKILSRPASSYAILLLSALFLAILGYLQYQWVGQVAEAERTRLEETLRAGLDRLNTDLNAQVFQLVSAFALREGADDVEERLRDNYRRWSVATENPELLLSLHIAGPGAAGAALTRFDPGTEALVPVDWQNAPAGLQQEIFSGNRVPAQTATALLPHPTAIVPMLAIPPGPPRSGPPFMAQADTWLVIELNSEFLLRTWLPHLIESHVLAPNPGVYQVAIVDSATKSIVARMPEAGDELAGAPDATRPLLRPGFGPPGRPRPRFEGPRFNGATPPGPPPTGIGPGPNRAFRRGPGDPRRGGPFPGILSGPAWELQVHHRSGSLAQAATELRTRNLAISFGILLILGLAVGMAMVSGHRARQLAELQMEFVGRVSHELKTPVTVIRSAAFNLSEGIVTEPEAVRQYGRMVDVESRRLGDMVDQIMLFSRMEAGRIQYNVRPVAVNDLTGRLLETMAPAIQQAGATVEVQLPDPPPMVMGDYTAIEQCLQSLLSNALKYGRRDDALRIRIEGRAADGRVTIAVRDEGPGIDPADVPHLFEAFYRGRNIPPDVPGNGLGLNLVRRTIEGLGGTVRVESGPDRGTSVTIDLREAGRAS